MKNILVDGVWVPLEDATPEQVLEYMEGLNHAQVMLRQEF